MNLTRRDAFSVLGGGLAASAGILPNLNPAQAAESIVAVEWGGPWVEVMKELTQKQQDVNVSWELHEGGSSTVLAKIKASWPHPRYDLVSSWSPVYASFEREGWYEPLTTDMLPVLGEYPEKLLRKDSAGKIVNVPRSLGAFFFGYRADKVPFPIKTLDDLLDPRLKGQICWNTPDSGTGCWLLPLALHGGGNEKNLEPGWEFTKRLAQSGNIGRVAGAETDFINSISSGETSVAFWDAGGWMGVAKNFPTVFLNKVPGDQQLKTYLFQEGWIILRTTEKKDPVLKYVEWMSSPENNSIINKKIGLVPAHPKAAVSEESQKWALKPDELDEFAYFPDWEYLSVHLAEITKRFETDIQPLL